MHLLHAVMLQARVITSVLSCKVWSINFCAGSAAVFWWYFDTVQFNILWKLQVASGNSTY